MFDRLLLRLFLAAVARAREERKDTERLEVKTSACPECGRWNPVNCRVCPRCNSKLYETAVYTERSEELD